MKRLRTLELVTIALMAAILCILAPISLPLSFTPIQLTLGLFAVLLVGIMLGSTRGVICVLIYILLGAVGAPVFSGYIGGIQKLLGPSGGYIWGYLPLVWITGFAVEHFSNRWYATLVGALIGTLACYSLGTVWLAWEMQLTPMAALWAGVIPFVPFDCAKILMAVVAATPIRSRLLQQNLLPKLMK